VADDILLRVEYFHGSRQALIRHVDGDWVDNQPRGQTSARSAVVKGDVLADVGVVTATDDVVRHRGNAIGVGTGRDNIGNHRAGGLTVGAHMVHFLWNEQVAEFAVGISVGCGNRPQERDGQCGS
jgi:hypothetical protein